MVTIRRKDKPDKKAPKGVPAKTEEKDDSAVGTYVGAFPGNPWERLTQMRHGRGSRVKNLSTEEQGKVILLAQKYFQFTKGNFAQARLKIQAALDHPSEGVSATFFQTALFNEKRLAVRAYLSNASGRFIEADSALPLLRHFADAGLDFEIGAVMHVINGAQKMEIVLGDAREVSSDVGYWFAHTHPAKTGITNNILPSTNDIDVMMATARALAQHLNQVESEHHVLRDIGGTKLHITTSIGKRPSAPVIKSVKLEYYLLGGEIDESIETQLKALKTCLRTRHGLKEEQIEIVQST